MRTFAKNLVLEQGLVTKSTGSWYYVRADSRQKVVLCKIKGTYRIKGIRATNPVAVGDRVSFSMLDDGTGLISEIHSRKNYIIRRATKLSSEYQLIAANIDQAMLMVSLAKPRTLLGFIDRFLVSAEAFRIPVIIVFNKLDLYSEFENEELGSLIELYSRIGYTCLPLSLKTRKNLDAAEALLASKVTVLSGNSGVGKSTLLNLLEPSLDIKTREISAYHNAGQHTTTFAEMFFFSSGARIIDTPGIKGFGTVDIDREELFHFFPEIFAVSQECRFNNCYHISEPDCAVINAVKEGRISRSRYMNYMDMMDDMQDKYRK